MIPKNVVRVNKVYKNDGYTSCDKDAANKLNEHFTSVGNILASKFSNIPTTTNTNLNVNIDSEFKFDLITPEYVFDEICKFSCNKATGLDGLDSKLLKLAAPVICDTLAYICNLSLVSSTFPLEWKQAKSNTHIQRW